MNINRTNLGLSSKSSRFSTPDPKRVYHPPGTRGFKKSVNKQDRIKTIYKKSGTSPEKKSFYSPNRFQRLPKITRITQDDRDKNMLDALGSIRKPKPSTPVVDTSLKVSKVTKKIFENIDKNFQEYYRKLELSGLLRYKFEMKRGLGDAKLRQITIPLMKLTGTQSSHKRLHFNKFPEIFVKYPISECFKLDSSKVRGHIRSIESYNLNFIKQKSIDFLRSNEDIKQKVREHARLRILLFHELALAYYNQKPIAPLRMTGAPVQFYSGNGLKIKKEEYTERHGKPFRSSEKEFSVEACHHSILPGIKDDLLNEWKEELEIGLEKKDLSPELVLKLLSFGINGGEIKELFYKTDQPDLDLTSEINHLWEKHGLNESFIGLRQQLGYFNNHTLLADRNLNLVDQVIETTRINAITLLNEVASGYKTPSEATNELIQIISDKMESELKEAKNQLDSHTEVFYLTFNNKHISLTKKDLEMQIFYLTLQHEETRKIASSEDIDEEMNSANLKAKQISLIFRNINPKLSRS